jgi:tetratricopeptide (TPR) repeat protein
LEDQKRLETALQRAIELTQATLSKNPNDIPAMYAQGVAVGLRGNYNFLIRKAWTDALKDLTASRKLHNRITDMQPSYTDARLVQGVHDYVVGSLPFTYKILGFVVGFRGDKDGGIKTVQLVAEKGTINKYDAKIMLAAVYRRERRPGDAIALLKELIARYPRNYLLRLEMVQMYGDLGDKQKALDALVELERLKRSNAPALVGMPFEKINFARGNLLFWYRDYDVAIAELRKATAKIKDLDFNAGATAYLRLGQCLDMKQQRAEAVTAYRAAVDLAPDSDPGRQAKNYLSSPYKRGKT